MANIREQAQFDTSGVRGFDKGGIDWARQSLIYTLKVYDTSDVKVAEIAGDLGNTTLTKLDFKTTRKGGCADFSFELANKLSGVNTDALLPHQTSGQVLSLNGSGYVSIADGSQAGLDGGLSDLMLGMWIKTSSTAIFPIFYKGGAGGYYDLHLNASTGYLECKLNDGSNTVTITGDIALNDDVWHLVRTSLDKSSATGGRLYADGAEDTSARTDITSIDNIDNDGTFYIGYDGSNFATGNFDEPEIWNFGFGGLPSDVATYDTWRYTNPHAALTDYDSGGWNGYADADQTDATGEKVTDGGLENWTGDLLDDWSEYGLSGGVRDLFDENGTGDGRIHGGTHAAKLEATLNNGTTDFYLQQIIPLTANKYYSFNGWYYFFARTNGRCHAYLQEMDFYTKISEPLDTNSTVGDYTYFEGVFQATDAANHCIILMSCDETTGVIYFDDISVKRVGLVGHWRFNGNYLDETSNSNDLTAGGTGNVFPEYYLPVIEYNYKTEIYLFNHFSPWFTGYIEEVPEAGTDKRQYYAGYGYFEKFNKKLINTNFTAQEISVIATTVLDDDIIANYPAITKNTDKIESTGYTLVGTLQFERQFARDVFNLLADVANDYEFGVDADAVFFFRAISTTILERFWVGTHITEFKPEKDYSKIVNRWYIYAPPFSDGSNYQIMVENGTSQSSYGLAEDFIDAPAIISIYSSTNIARGKTATANPAVGTPGNMVDGVNSTFWYSGTYQIIGHWIKIDLGSTYDSVAKVVLDSIYSTVQGDHARLFKIEVSTNDSDYTEVFSASSDPGWKPTITFQPVAARYIKITLTVAVDDRHWKVGEFEVYELDTADLERWGAQVLTDSKDPILRAVATIKGIDKVLLERQIVAPINPRGKCRITDTDGTTTHDYAIISCEYSLSSSGLDLTMELGHAKREVSDWIRTLRRQIAENRLLGIRRGDNIASGTGFGQGSILSTMIAENAIETPHLRANLITAAKLAALSVDTEHLVAGAVEADKINVTQLDAISIDVGTLTAGTITSGLSIGASLRKVYDYTLTGNATSVSLSGLLGNTDKHYFISCKWIMNGSGTGNFGIQCNGDTGGSSYSWHTIWNGRGAGVNATGWNDSNWFMMWFGRADNDGYLSQGQGWLQAQSGYPRTLIGHFLRQITPAGIIESLYSFGNTWKNTGSELTSLRFLCEDANGLKIGTRIEVWKRVS